MSPTWRREERQLERLRQSLARDTVENASRFVWRPADWRFSPPMYERRWTTRFDALIPLRWRRWEAVLIDDHELLSYGWVPGRAVPDGWVFSYTPDGCGWIRPLSWGRVVGMAYATPIGPSRSV